MEFLQLVYFCSAAETENFAETARRFSVPPASISQSIKRLEKDIGVTLFDRSKKGVKLNEFGRIWYHSSKTSLALLEDAKKRINQEELKGTIRLLVLANRFLVSDAISSFLQNHKDVNFIIDYYRKNTLDSYDLIITDNVDSTFELKNCAVENLILDDIVLAVHKDSVLAQKDEITIADLEGRPFITLNDDSGLYAITRRMCTRGGFSFKPVFICDDPRVIINLVDKNFGIAVVPKQAWKNIFTENIRFKNVLIPIKDYHRKQTKLVRMKNKYLTRVVRAFMLELYETAEKYKKE